MAAVAIDKIFGNTDTLCSAWITRFLVDSRDLAIRAWAYLAYDSQFLFALASRGLLLSRRGRSPLLLPAAAQPIDMSPEPQREHSPLPQALEAIEILLHGFQTAADRDRRDAAPDWLQQALGRDGEHLYQGLLTLVLRLVFILYAEARSLLPVEEPFYINNLGLGRLYERLAHDAASQPERMRHRFSAYGQLLALSRAIFGGIDGGDFELPAHRGELFDPDAYPFLEGRLPGSIGVSQPPSVDDETVFHALRRLFIVNGEALDYRVLDIEQLGGIYESLIGYRAVRLDEPGSRGRIAIQPGEQRRQSGSHYTPRPLTETIVRRTLEPIIDKLGETPAADDLLNLKICDPAMGSGAFLLAVCRELAKNVVVAWDREGKLRSITQEHGDAHVHARSLVAQRCLYGVDKNPVAVELAKLSLWLISEKSRLPFTFLDHGLRHGDSLVGLDIEQISAFHWHPPGQAVTIQHRLNDALEEAIAARQEILSLGHHDDPTSQSRKRALFNPSQRAVERARIVADACVGAYFDESTPRTRELERKRRLALVNSWLSSEREVESVEEREEALGTSRAAEAELRLLAKKTRERLLPFHWWIEFPELFFGRGESLWDSDTVKRAGEGLDGVVGNPPFMGGRRISGEFGDDYSEWLAVVNEAGTKNADLSAHFFRRAAKLLGHDAAFGLIATNTIAQGDTRLAGLAALIREGWIIYDASESLSWPGAAVVAVSIVHAARGRLASGVERHLNRQKVSIINSHLRAKPERPDPHPLMANANASFNGFYLLGMGFTLTQEERDDLIRRDPRNGERIFPYLGGEEVNASPTQSYHRFVINFEGMQLEEAEGWPDLLAILRERIKPNREKLKRYPQHKYWWRFWADRPELRAALAPLSRCLVTARVSKHSMFAFQPTDRVFSEQLYVFPLDGFSQFAILQSRIHEPWARLLSSTLGKGLRYSASSCFETFPFPTVDPRATISHLEAIGERLYQARASLMLDNEEGLTKTYNRLKSVSSSDARIAALRRLHEELDRAVLEAYGWADIEVPPYCPMNDEERAMLRDFEDEIIDRLYLLNAERADREA